MRIWRRSGPPSERELVGLADGSLRGQRRAEVERGLEEHPRLRAAVAAQRRVLSAIEQAAAEPAPHALRARLALARPPTRRSARIRVIGLATAGSAAVAGAAAGLVVAISGGAVAQASVLQAAQVTNRTAQHAVSEPRRGVEYLPGVRANGLTYPSWDDHFGFRASGVRYDRVGGHLVTTVFYSRGATRVAYEIAAGAPLRLGGPAMRTMTRQGLVLHVLSSSRGPVVTWTRDGHTCVLVGRPATLPVLLKLAAWREGGRIPY
jgi:hypothetical protein